MPSHRAMTVPPGDASERVIVAELVGCELVSAGVGAVDGVFDELWVEVSLGVAEARALAIASRLSGVMEL